LNVGSRHVCVCVWDSLDTQLHDWSDDDQIDCSAEEWQGTE